jgi:hypothetical protein
MAKAAKIQLEKEYHIRVEVAIFGKIETLPGI